MAFVHKNSRPGLRTGYRVRDQLEDFTSDKIVLGRVVEQLGEGALKCRVFGRDDTGAKTRVVKMLSPHMSIKGSEYLGADPKNFEDTQTVSGMVFPMPQIGTIGLIALAMDNDSGFWLGAVIEAGLGQTIPDFATSGQLAADKSDLDDYASPIGLPAGERNTLTTDNREGHETKTKRAIHPFAEILKKQGLLVDPIRGQTTSNVTRDGVHSILGFNTPGAFGEKKDLVTSTESGLSVERKITNLGGHTFTMDDGDYKGQNNLVRLRSSKGAQILLHDTEDVVYIGNQNGSAWIEMTADGKIDIYAGDSVSIHSKGDFNFRADRDVNIEGGRNVNIKAVARQQLEAETFNLLARKDGRIEVRGTLDFQAADTRMMFADWNIQSNNIDISNKLNTRVRTGELDLVSQFGQRYSAGTGMEYKTNVLENQIWNAVTYNPSKVYQKGNTVIFGTQFFKALKTTRVPETAPAVPVPPAPGEFWEIIPPVVPETTHGDFRIDTNIDGPLPAQFQVNSKSHIKLTTTEGKVEVKALADTIDIQSSANVYVDGAQVHLNLPGPGAIPADPIAIPSLSLNVPVPFDTQSEAAFSVAPLSLHTNPVTDVSLEWKEGYYLSDTPLYSIMKRVPMHEPWPNHETKNKDYTSMIATDREPNE